MNIVIATGGFDPIHSGHIQYFKAAKTLGDKLIVGLNSDEWLTRKKGRPFTRMVERLAIIESLAVVDQCVLYDDSDDTSIQAIKQVRELYPAAHIIFANGGDRTKDNIPEMALQDDNLEFVFGVGGEDKKNSSSWILQEYKAAKTKRNWGYYRVLHEIGKGVKVKELTVDPNQGLSMQQHFKRNELWFIAEGIASVYTMHNGRKYLNRYYHPHEYLHINPEEWHQLKNEQSIPLKIIEIQYGKECVEEDIIRK